MAKKECGHRYMVVVARRYGPDPQARLRCTNPACEHEQSFQVKYYWLPRYHIGDMVKTQPEDEALKSDLSAEAIPFHFFVIGLPAPQGSKRAFTPPGGRFTKMIEMSKKVGPWREAVAAAAIDAAQGFGWKHEPTGPIRVDITFWLPAPKSVKRLYPTTNPDADKLARSTYDGLTMSGAIMHDDNQIVEGTQRKRYVLPGMATGASIIITRLED